MYEEQKQIAQQVQQSFRDVKHEPIDTLPGAVERLEDLNQKLVALDNLLCELCGKVGAYPADRSTQSEGDSFGGHINALHYQIDRSSDLLELVLRQVNSLNEVLA